MPANTEARQDEHFDHDGDHAEAEEDDLLLPRKSEQEAGAEEETE